MAASGAPLSPACMFYRQRWQGGEQELANEMKWEVGCGWEARR